MASAFWVSLISGKCCIFFLLILVWWPEAIMKLLATKTVFVMGHGVWDKFQFFLQVNASQCMSWSVYVTTHFLSVGIFVSLYMQTNNIVTT